MSEKFRERYAVIEYIDYDNHSRYQKCLNCMTPLE